MTTDTITEIKAAEREAAALTERSRADAAEKLRSAKAVCEKRIAEESERLLRQFGEEQSAAQNEAESLLDEEETASFHEAEKFVRSASAHLPDTVRFIVGGIIGKWQ